MTAGAILIIESGPGKGTRTGIGYADPKAALTGNDAKDQQRATRR